MQARPVTRKKNPIHLLRRHSWHHQQSQQEQMVILNVMEAYGIPCYDCSSSYLCNKLGERVAVATHPQFLASAKWSTKRCGEEPKCSGEFLTVVTQLEHLIFFFYMMEHKSCIWHIHRLWPESLFNSAWNSMIQGWSQSFTTNVCSTSLFTSIQVQSGCFLKHLSFLCF